MDWFQGVVLEYLRADRSAFVNPECLLNLDADDVYRKDRHWYCDAVTVNFKEQTVWLCEITYAENLHALVRRLRTWQSVWPELERAVIRDCNVPASWRIRPRVFIPHALADAFAKRFPNTANQDMIGGSMTYPKITNLEEVLPWNRRGSALGW